MSVHHHDHPLATLSSHRARPVWEGLVALLVLVALVATLCGIATWAAVQLFRMV